MLIYNYHPESGEFIGASEADPNPVRPDDFIIPANATTIEPPGDPSAGHAMAWDGKEWVEIKDHRGETWWTAAGESMTINKIGDPTEYDLLAESPHPEPAPLGRLRFALVHDGVVLQVLEAECSMQWQLLAGCRMVVDEAAEALPGYSFDGKSFLPPPSEPETVN